MKTEVDDHILYRLLDFIVNYALLEHAKVPLHTRELDILIEEALLLAEEKNELKELRLALGHALASSGVSLQKILGQYHVSEEILLQIAQRVYELNFSNEPYDPEKEPVELV